MNRSSEHEKGFGFVRFLLLTVVAGAALAWLFRREESTQQTAGGSVSSTKKQPDHEDVGDLESHQVPGVDPLPPREPPM